MNIDIEDIISRPLETIERLRNGLATPDAESDFIARFFAEALGSGAHPALYKVPLLSREKLTKGKLPPNSLVRYRGMIQDQYEPEYFIGSFEEVETATGRRSQRYVKYADTIQQRPGFLNDFEGDGAKTMERRLPLFCIPIPGLATWARDVDEDLHTLTVARTGQGESTTKRQRDDGADATEYEGGDHAASDSQLQMETPGAQRKSLRVSGSSSSNAGGCTSESRGPYEAGTSRQPTIAFENQQELDLAGLPCLVKVYDFEENKLRLNNTAEFVGILAYDESVPAQHLSTSTIAGENCASDPFQGLESFARKIPPPSLAPRLHCIFHRDLPACAPLAVDPNDPRSALYALQGPLPFGIFMRESKRQAIEHLAEFLGGDALAAEYALLTLISRVYMRTESMAPGSLTLSLSRVSADMACRIYTGLSELVPVCVRVPVTTESLAQKFKFAPRKDYEADRLMLSKLQLSEGTVVILDETGLQSGQIGEEGMDNLEAIGSLLRLQKIPYDFGYYKMEFEVDHPTISLSTRRSVVSTMASVPVVASLNETNPIRKASSDAASEAVLGRLRVYVEATRRMKLSLDKSASTRAEEDFVKARQQRKEVTGDDFHRWLTVARLTALSLGEETVKESHWSHMKNLEAQVARRANSLGGRAGEEGVSGTTTAPASDGDLR